MLERADTLEAIGLITFAPLLYSMKGAGFVGQDTLFVFRASAKRLAVRIERE